MLKNALWQSRCDKKRNFSPMGGFVHIPQYEFIIRDELNKSKLERLNTF